MLSSHCGRLAARSVLRQSGQKRSLSIKNIFESKNTIAEKRVKYYSNPAVGADNPTYLKEPGDKVVLGAAIGGGVFGFLMFLNGLYNMSYGINKK